MMLVIFDCDGVLVDSERLSAEVFSAQLALFGIAMTPAECEEMFRGHTMDYCFQELERLYPNALPEDFLSLLAVASEKYFSEHLRPVPGVEAVLQWLQKINVPFCVASNGSLKKIRHSLSVVGFGGYFEDRCFSAESVPQGKPAPDLFLSAARHMGFSPNETIVVEDSVAGVTAAKRAGMTVFRYTSVQDANLNVISFDHMSKLQSLIENHQPT
jgi:HAD superfamily hydrolase (TIGR01509 family)